MCDITKKTATFQTLVLKNLNNLAKKVEIIGIGDFYPIESSAE